MKVLRVLLWINAGLFFLAIPFMVLPWDSINAFIAWFGVEPLPAVPVLMYLVRMMCGLSALGGVFFVLLARDPVRYAAMVWLVAWGLLVLGILAVVLGLAISLEPIIFMSDAAFCIDMGLVLAVLAAHHLPLREAPSSGSPAA